MIWCFCLPPPNLSWSCSRFLPLKEESFLPLWLVGGQDLGSANMPGLFWGWVGGRLASDSPRAPPAQTMVACRCFATPEFSSLS